ncbi:Aste57867_23096 [Aphanomyces stellatus]|uniref:Aste57867_23096 protein n=1 Tax=Aphanomyces stellatus TaxID=120398 RepID=A0A485LLY7_9STRA|nr:hypothetical protein As57867_023025 [Aphanomyces stellatus]VFT99744.1 Aste57867_23096 [Aphanomyces stellatus]
MPDASRRIDEFVNRAFKSYQDAVIAKHKKDKSRYMYMSAPTPPSTEDGSATSGVQKYKRYGLSEDKTFESLFFDEKKALMDLLDNFVNKSGKFGIKGFPYKMGLLLHGPPGTGKTSLIKAVAQYTRRHIVNISLAKIKTNQELMNLMFDLKFGLDGEDMPVTLGFDKIVFVMEDIDCASNVVMARDDKAGKRTKKSTKESGSTDGDDDDDDDDADLVTLSKMAGISSDDVLDLDKLIGPSNNKMGGRSFGPNDKLNLSGLLNVLDGVVDSPGRILIMTTNHPEKLDPALIRPGRVNKKLMMGHINAKQTQLMMQHYFQCELTDAQKTAVIDVFANTAKDFSPAQIEQLCAEYDDVVQMLDELAKLGD